MFTAMCFFLSQCVAMTTERRTCRLSQGHHFTSHLVCGVARVCVHADEAVCVCVLTPPMGVGELSDKGCLMRALIKKQTVY